MMKVRLAAVVYSFLLLILATSKTTSPAYACSCAEHPIGEDLEQADAIFYGTVVATAEATPQSKEFGFGNRTVMTFRVLSSWKGSVGPEVTVYSGTGGGDCGVRFEVGDNVLVIAYDEEEDLYTGLCSYFTKEKGADAFRALGPGSPPLDPELMANHGAPGQHIATPQSNNLVVYWSLAVAVALISALAVIIIARTRQRRGT
jgi:hypothetical protein